MLCFIKRGLFTIYDNILLFFLLVCLFVFLLPIGADPTLKDNSGYQAVEYAGNVKIKEFLLKKMDVVIDVTVYLKLSFKFL